MISAGIQGLFAYGAQNMYLTGNPQITYMKRAHRRHTNFCKDVDIKKVTLSPGKSTSVNLYGSDMVGDITILGIDEKDLDKVQILVNGIIFTEMTGLALHLFKKIADSKKQIGVTVTLPWNNRSIQQINETPYYLPTMLTSETELRIFMKHSSKTYTNVNVLIEKLYVSTQERKSMLSNTKGYNRGIPNEIIEADTVELIDDEFEKTVNSLMTFFLCAKKNFNIVAKMNIFSFMIDLKKTSTFHIPISFPHPTRELFWVVQDKNEEDPFTFCNPIESVEIYQNPSCSVLFKNDIVPEQSADYFQEYQQMRYHFGYHSNMYCHSFSVNPLSYHLSGHKIWYPDYKYYLKLVMKRYTSNYKLKLFSLGHNIVWIDKYSCCRLQNYDIINKEQVKKMFDIDL